MPAAFASVLAEHLHCYQEILGAARDLVRVLECESFDRLDALQARRQAAMQRIDAMGPLPLGLRRKLRETLGPILTETERLDARAATLLDGYLRRVIEQVGVLPLTPDALPGEIARYIDLHG